MRVPERILVPVDLSERSELAVEYAGALAERLGATLIVFTNVNVPEQAALEELVLAEDISLLDAAHSTLDRIAQRRAPGVTHETEVRFDDFPGEGILAAVDRTGADLVVIGSHGRTGMKRVLLGSVAEKIVRSSDIPVLVVPARES